MVDRDGAPALIGPTAAPGLQVMSYNIRRRMVRAEPGSPDRWSSRKVLMRRLLAAEQPSIVGVQEALDDQTRFVAESLGASYRWIGNGRDADRRGEGCPIFYDSDRVELGEWQQLWLSDTPLEAGSRSWGNGIPRVLVDAHFTDLDTGMPLRFINTHFDHRSRVSRVHSAHMVNTMVGDTDAATVVTGDFNTDIDSVTQRALTGDRLVDSWHVAESRLTPEWGTYSGYDRPRLGRKRIDWILTRNVDVSCVGINTTRFDGAAASDHEPVQAVLRPALRQE